MAARAMALGLGVRIRNFSTYEAAEASAMRSMNDG
jgi:hypothetical protein